MNTWDSRLRKLEDRLRGSCLECSGSAGIVVIWPGEPEDLEEHMCPKCGRQPIVIRVVYDGSSAELEGGGGEPY